MSGLASSLFQTVLFFGSSDMKRILFIDRDGTLIHEAPPTYQIDVFEKLEFYPHMFEYMGGIARELDYELIMVTNQDGLGTPSYPEDTFWPVQHFVMKSLENEGIRFSAVHIDPTRPQDHAPTRKPGIGMLLSYLNNPNYDIPNSYVIGDRITDVQLAKNLGCKAIWLNNDSGLGSKDATDSRAELDPIIALETKEWSKIYSFLKNGIRHVVHERNTRETQIHIDLNIDGTGKSAIATGLGFFDHMLDQIARHAKLDLTIEVKGDLFIDEPYRRKGIGQALGEAFAAGLS
jgi:imidazoleglycerol-phosphate dehydratase/histidinol-phosphatase